MKVVIADGRIDERALCKLRLLGYLPLCLPKCSGLPEAISGHPDSLILQIGSTVISSADFCEEAAYFFSDLREACPEITVTLTADTLSDKFPGDCLYNGLIVGKYLFCRRDSLAAEAIRLAEESGLEIISVKQGYPACSALALGDKAIITADRGLIRAAESVGIRGYEIEAGGISLPPYAYGFIGGASGVKDGVVYFIGDYKKHPSAKTIDLALDEQGYKGCSLSDEHLCDMGGLRFI